MNKKAAQNFFGMIEVYNGVRDRDKKQNNN